MTVVIAILMSLNECHYSLYDDEESHWGWLGEDMVERKQPEATSPPTEVTSPVS